MAQQGGGSSDGVDEQENRGGGASDVKQQLLARLMGSGMLNSVKVGAAGSFCHLHRLHSVATKVPGPCPCTQAHLRATLFAELKGSDLNSALAPAPSPTLQQHVLNCLVRWNWC